MWSGQDTDHTCKVSGRVEHVQGSCTAFDVSWQIDDELSNSRGRHFHTLRLLRSILITFDHPRLLYILAKFYLSRSYPVWVHSFWKWSKMSKNHGRYEIAFKMADFLLNLEHRCQLHFCVSWWVTYAYQISKVQVTRTGRSKCLKFCRWRCGAILPQSCAFPLNHQMVPRSTYACQFWGAFDSL